MLTLAFLPAAAWPTPRAEQLRGFWVCPWEMNSPAAVAEVVTTARAFNFNAIFYEVRYRGDALYVPNKYSRRFPNAEPRSPHLAGQPATFDPLAELIAQAHAAGIEVHAWVTTFVILNKKTPTPPGHVAVSHPEWLSQNDRGDVWDPYGMAWLEPALPEVQNYLLNVFLDIVTNYDVDGLHLDYVRYPSPAFGRNPSAIRLFAAETGKSPDDAAAFAAWRREKISAFVKQLYETLTAEKPNCKLTAAVFPSRTSTAFHDCLQDWTTWLAEGYVDGVMPMAYNPDADVVHRQISDAVTVAAGRHIYAGLMVPEVSDEKFNAAVAAEMVNKANRALAASPTGVVIFSYGGLVKKDNLIAAALKENLFGSPARPSPMPWKDKRRAPRAEVVAVRAGRDVRFAVRLPAAGPRRYAYLLAKEVSARAAVNEVNIKSEGTKSYRVYVGFFPEKRSAEEVLARLRDLGYGN